GWGRAVHAALAGAADPFDGGHLSVGRRGRTSRALWLVPALYVAAALRAATGADPMVAVGLRCAHRHPLYYSADDAGDRRLVGRQPGWVARPRACRLDRNRGAGGCQHLLCTAGALRRDPAHRQRADRAAVAPANPPGHRAIGDLSAGTASPTPMGWRPARLVQRLDGD